MKRVISDDDIDRLLAAPLRDPTPEFDRRLDGLAARLTRTSRMPGWRQRWRRWAWWTAPVAAAAAAVALWLNVAPPAAPAADYELLFELDASLAAATPLLDPLNRELCLETLSTASAPSHP